MIHQERRRENLKRIEEMDKRDAEPLQPDWKTYCMNKKVDMVEVVRCKDCKFAYDSPLPYQHGKKWCDRSETHHKPDWFCADGERRTE